MNTLDTPSPATPPALAAAQLRAENITLRAAQKICADCDGPTHEEVTRLHAAVERADAIYQRACEVEHELRAELATERARLDYLLQWDVTFHDRADIDAEIGYAQRKKSVPTLP